MRMKDDSVPVRIDTPPRSKFFHRGLPGTVGVVGMKPPGIRSVPENEMSAATIATNQKIHDQFTYWTNIAPTNRPRTIASMKRYLIEVVFKVITTYRFRLRHILQRYRWLL